MLISETVELYISVLPHSNPLSLGELYQDGSKLDLDHVSQGNACVYQILKVQNLFQSVV